jgi:predicted RNase H-like nuclease (RuvC/YqgF family)
MNEQERELDLMVAELETENKMMRARNERLERELDTAVAERDRFKEALERILTVSRVALWNGGTQGVKEVGPQARERVRECND